MTKIPASISTNRNVSALKASRPGPGTPPSSSQATSIPRIAFPSVQPTLEAFEDNVEEIQDAEQQYEQERQSQEKARAREQ